MKIKRWGDIISRKIVVYQNVSTKIKTLSRDYLILVLCYENSVSCFVTWVLQSRNTVLS